MERASTAAYIAYQRANNSQDEADALAVLGRALSERKLWRPALDALRLSLDQREVAEVRGQYERLRDEHGFRLLDYSVDSDSASPRACFQFSEDLAKRVDFSPFVALAGTDKPAITSEGKQLCVDGLKHGERYNINLRAGLPSTVKEGLPKSAEFNIYVRRRRRTPAATTIFSSQPNGSSSPISAYQLSRAMTASMSLSIRWPRPRRWRARKFG
jgi:uncharacterized protein YfaS (alpha-2-macroglobulin family)